MEAEDTKVLLDLFQKNQYMSSFRNLRIRQITIPEMADGELTGEYIDLEVVSQEILKRTINAYEGGTVTEEQIVFVCFRNMVGRTRQLFIINPEDFDEITIKRFEHEINEQRYRSKANRKRNQTGRDNSDS